MAEWHPPWDEEALRRLARIEHAIVRLDLPCQGEFIAILNAIEMQLERADPDVETVAHLGDALCSLATARGVNAKRMRLEKQLHALLDRILIITGQRATPR